MNYSTKVFKLGYLLRLFSLATIVIFSNKELHAQQSRLKLIPKPSDKEKVMAVVNEGTTPDNTGLKITTAEAARVSLNHLREYGHLYKIKTAPESEYSFAGLNPLYNFTVMQQNYMGIPILGSTIKVGINKYKEAYFSAGNYIDITPKKFAFGRGLSRNVTENRAKFIVLKDLMQEFNDAHLSTLEPKFLRNFFTTMEAKLYIYNKDFLTTGIPSDLNQLVWVVKVSLSPHQSYKYVINAINGKIILSMDDRQHANGVSGYNKVCDYAYGCSCNLTTGRQGNDPAKGLHAKYNNLDIDETFDLFHSARTYYAYEFDRLGANNSGGTGDGINIALTESAAKANYTGCSASECIGGNAWYVNGSLTFCAGSVSANVLGHEYFHAFIDSLNSTVFLPNSESAAIHEAIADFFGEDFEYYDTDTFDGVYGTGSNLFGQRSLRQPSEFEYQPVGSPDFRQFPTYYNSNTYYCGNHSDYKYFNSTVISHAFYKAAIGGQHRCCMIEGIGFPKVVGILYHTLINRLTAVTNFLEFYNAAESACYGYIYASNNYYGVTEADCQQFVKALQAAEIDLPGGCNGNQPANNNFAASCAVYPPGNNQYGDFNNNGSTDGGDYLTWQRFFGCQGVNVPGDANGDGYVDSADYTVWKDRYGTPVPQASPYYF